MVTAKQLRLAAKMNPADAAMLNGAADRLDALDSKCRELSHTLVQRNAENDRLQYERDVLRKRVDSLAASNRDVARKTAAHILDNAARQMCLTGYDSTTDVNTVVDVLYPLELEQS